MNATHKHKPSTQTPTLIAEKVLGRMEKGTLELELGHNLLGPVGGAHLFDELKRISNIWREEAMASSSSSGRPAGLSSISINRNRLSNECLPEIAAYLDGNLTTIMLNLAANVLHVCSSHRMERISEPTFTRLPGRHPYEDIWPSNSQFELAGTQFEREPYHG